MPLIFKKIKKREKHYVKQLAREEIKINPKRINQHKTFLIYNDTQRIGFIAYQVRNNNSIYIYMLAFEKHAQRQGFAPQVLQWMENKECNKYPIKKVSARIKKMNQPAIYVAQKYGYHVVAVLPKLFVLEKKI